MNLSNLVEEYCTQLRRRWVRPLQHIPGFLQQPHTTPQHASCPHAPTAPLDHPCCCRQIHGSFACAKKTAEVMRLLITTQRHPDAASLIEDVRTVGTKLQAAKPVGACQAAGLSAGWPALNWETTAGGCSLLCHAGV